MPFESLNGQCSSCGCSTTRRISRALCKKAFNVVIDEFTHGDDKGMSIEGDATLDLLAKIVADSGERLFEFHNTNSTANSMVHDYPQGVQVEANR